MMRKHFFLPMVSLFLVFCSCDWQHRSDLLYGEAPRNVILFIGDGMGVEQAKAGSVFRDGSGTGLAFQGFPFVGSVKTRSADNAVTDSAAAATAMATGYRVNNGVVSVSIPGDRSSLLTLLEYLRGDGRATGLVSTKFITDATPAAFGAHQSSRALTENIARDYLERSRPDLLLGGGGYGMTDRLAEDNGYTVVKDAAQLAALPDDARLVSGQFGPGSEPYEYDGLGDLPGLSDMVDKAIAMLSGDRDGFFLMAEGGLIDTACHANDLGRAIREVLEFDDAVSIALAWASGRTDTLIIVVADHETGGLRDVSGTIGSVAGTFSTTGHTPADVPVYAWGEGAERFAGSIENRLIPCLILGMEKE